MKIVILEDEPAAAQRISKLLVSLDEGIEVIEIMDSIESSVDWFINHRHPDLVVMDIHLADGLSFEILKEIELDCPILFTTAYDQYAIQAFKLNSIDYLLKPVKLHELKIAIEKFKNHYSSRVNYTRLIDLLEERGQPERRIVIKIGQSIKMIHFKNVAFFHTAHKLNYAHLFSGRKYPVDLSLDRIEELVPSHQFFRVNRQYIINLEAIHEMLSYSKSRVKIVLDKSGDLSTVVSAERALAFKKWLSGDM